MRLRHLVISLLAVAALVVLHPGQRSYAEGCALPGGLVLPSFVVLPGCPAAATPLPAAPSSLPMGAPATPSAPSTDVIVAGRSYGTVVPSGYDASQPAPLLLLLHGYGDGLNFRQVFDFAALAEAHGVLLAYPLGSIDLLGKRFWNGTDACCDGFRTGVDDVAFLSAVIDDMERRYNVDRSRVFVFGSSNGAFMAHRVACDLSARVAAVVAVAGDGWLDGSRCEPGQPVAVLQIHGDADEMIRYDGGDIVPMAAYPSAQASISDWATRDRCSSAPDTSPAPFDLSAEVPGAETSAARFTNCADGGWAELWTIHGGTHDPHFAVEFPELVWGFLSAHGRVAQPTLSIGVAAPGP